MSLGSRRNALLGALTWFAVKRRLRKKGTDAMGLLAKLAKLGAVVGGIWLFLKKRGRKDTTGEA